MSGLSARVRVRRSEFELNVELEVAPGEVLALLGPNGAGKSTLLDVLAGTRVPESGSVRLDDRTLTDTAQRVWSPPHRRSVGLLAQQPLLFPHLNALDNVAFGPRSGGMNKRASRDTARRWLTEVDADGLAARRPVALSGGQGQRVALARALAAEPKLLLLDEPLAALDVDATPAVRGVLHRVLAARKRPTVLVTHDLLDALVLADRVMVLSDGEVAEQGKTSEVCARPRDPFMARIAGLNLIAGVITEQGLRVGERIVTGTPHESPQLGEAGVAVFSPTAVAVHRQRPNGSPRNAFRMRLDGIEPRGDVVRLRAQATDERCVLSADVTPSAVAELGLVPGDQVWFVVKATEVAVHPAAGGSSACD